MEIKRESIGSGDSRLLRSGTPQPFGTTPPVEDFRA